MDEVTPERRADNEAGSDRNLKNGHADARHQEMAGVCLLRLPVTKICRKEQEFQCPGQGAELAVPMFWTT